MDLDTVSSLDACHDFSQTDTLTEAWLWRTGWHLARGEPCKAAGDEGSSG
jgi:hypothetical protein